MEEQRYDVAPELVDVRLFKIAEGKIIPSIRLPEMKHAVGVKNRYYEKKSD